VEESLGQECFWGVLVACTAYLGAKLTGILKLNISKDMIKGACLCNSDEREGGAYIVLFV
jgi:hypothetical protein